MAAFHYGFSSNVLVNDEDGPRGPVLGANLRSDHPLAGYVLVGPMFEFASYELGYYFDLDVYVRARVPIDAKKVQFQIWAGVPVGLTFDFLSGDLARTLDSGRGGERFPEDDVEGDAGHDHRRAAAEGLRCVQVCA